MRPITPGSATLLALAAMTLEGCAGAPLPATHYYTLTAPRPAAAVREAPATGLAVAIAPLAVDPPYDQDRLVYRFGVDAPEVGFYSYHRWAAPLDDLVAVALADGLRQTRGIAAIESAGGAFADSARLRGRILYVEEIDAPGARQVRIGLELALRGDDGQILWSDRLEAARRLEATSVGEIVVALRQVLDQIVARARSGIESALDRAPGP